MSDQASFDPYAMSDAAIQAPPDRLWPALKKIGPGIILAGSIIGSGELLLTTSLGAEYGFVFLWLILFSCVIKVFVQIELGRYAISSGKPTLAALDELPGPRFGAHWLVWWWFIMLMATVFQLGAMVGGVGQALNLAFPKVSAGLASWLAGFWPQLSEATRGAARASVGGSHGGSCDRLVAQRRLSAHRARDDVSRRRRHADDRDLCRAVAQHGLSDRVGRS